MTSTTAARLARLDAEYDRIDDLAAVAPLYSDEAARLDRELLRIARTIAELSR